MSCQRRPPPRRCSRDGFERLVRNRVPTMAPLLVTLAFASLPPGDRPHPPPDPRTAELVRLARDRNRAAIASIRTLSCRFTQEVVGELPPEVAAAAAVGWLVSGQFWRDGPTVRLRLVPKTYPPPLGIADPTTEDRLIRGGRTWVLKTRPDLQPPWSDLSVYPSESVSDGQVWRYCLFTHRGRPDAGSWKSDGLTFDELLAGPYEVARAGRVTEDGRDSIHVELANPDERLGFWFDPEFNYLLWKTTTIPTGNGGHRTERQVTEFVRSVDGAVLPVRIEQRRFERGRLTAAVCTVLSDVRINKPLSPDDLRLPNIAGMPCADFIRKSRYPVDADGNPAGPEMPSLNGPNPGHSQPAVGGLPDVGPPPRGQEWPVGVALLGAFLVIVVVASYAGRRARRLT